MCFVPVMCHTDPLSPIFIGFANGKSQFERQKHLQYEWAICILEWQAVLSMKNLYNNIKCCVGSVHGMGGHFQTNTSTIRDGCKLSKGMECEAIFKRSP